MTAVEIGQLIVGGYATAWTLYLLCLPLMAIAWKATVKAREICREIQRPSIAVIIPGRNVSQILGRCISALRACNYPIEKINIYVAADHCTDDTEERAQSAGATALLRDEGPTGKTYTLAWTFDVLKKSGLTADLYVVVDATACVESSFLQAFTKSWQEGAHIIANHTVVASDNRRWYARCLGLMFVHRNLQNWSREEIGLSALLTGCGMAFSRDYIQQFGWRLALPKTQGSHPTEDWRHAVRAVDEGYRVAFADNARVSTPLRSSLSEATQQGARWERGRLINAGTYAVRLLARGLWQRNPIKILAALDAMQPPVAILAIVSLFVAATGAIASEFFLVNVAVFLPLILVVLYGLVVVIRGRQEGIGVATAIWGPVYVGWRFAAFMLSWAFLDRIDLRKRAAKSTHQKRSTPSPDQNLSNL